MGRLTPLLAAALLLLWPTVPARAFQVEQWAGPIADASARFGIPERWIRRVMAAESGGRTRLNGRLIRSHAGAMGLMQLMPRTWQAMRMTHGLGADPDDPRDNILAGTAYLRLMYDRFGYPGLFAAYNAGPGAYAAYLAGQRRLPAETHAYVAQVGREGVPLPSDRAARAPARSATVVAAREEPPHLFALRRSTAAPAAELPASQSSPRPGASLFVALRSAGP